MQSSWLAVVVNVKRGYVAGARTMRSNDWSANVGQRGDPGIRGTGTTRAVSPDWRVFVRVTVRRAPELVNETLPRDNAVRAEKVSRERGTRLAVLKNVKKPMRKADHNARWAESQRLRWARNCNKMEGEREALRWGTWTMDFSKPFWVNFTWMSSKAVVSKWQNTCKRRRALR